jgi:hypothetical protein
VKYFSEILNVSYFTTTLVGLFCFKYLNRRIKIFFFYILINCVNQIFITVYAKLGMVNVQFFAFFSLCTYFFSIYQLKVMMKKFFILTSIVLSIPILLCLFLFGFERFNVPLYVVTSFYLVTISFSYIIKMLNDDKKFDIFKNPEFYVNSGLIILFFTMFSSIVLVEYSGKAGSFQMIYEVFIALANIISSLFYIKAFTCSKKAM